MKRVAILIGLLAAIYVWYQIWTPEESPKEQPSTLKEEEKQTQEKIPKQDQSKKEEATERESKAEKLDIPQPKIQDVTGGELKPPNEVVQTAGRFHWLVHLSEPIDTESVTESVLQELEKISRPEIVKILREQNYTVPKEEQVWNTILVGAISKGKGEWKVHTVAQINHHPQPTRLVLTLKKGDDGKWKVWDLSKPPS